MAVDRVSVATETTERVNIDTAGFSSSDSYRRDRRNLTDTDVPYGHRLSRLGRLLCRQSICCCNTRQ